MNKDANVRTLQVGLHSQIIAERRNLVRTLPVEVARCLTVIILHSKWDLFWVVINLLDIIYLRKSHIASRTQCNYKLDINKSNFCPPLSSGRHLQQDYYITLKLGCADRNFYEMSAVDECHISPFIFTLFGPFRPFWLKLVSRFLFPFLFKGGKKK